MTAGAAAALLQALRSHADRPAIIAGERHLSHRDVLTQSLALAASFERLGLPPGGVVMISLQDSTDTILSLLAAWWRGATPLVMDFRSRPAQRAQVAAAAKVSLAIETRTGELSASYGGVAWSDGWLFAANDPDRTPEGLGADVPAAYALSSGTTGTPKIYVQSQGMLERRLRARAYPFPTGEGRLLTPMSIAFSATRHSILDFLMGGGVIYLEPQLFTASELAERLTSVGANVTALAPPVIRALAREIGPRDTPYFGGLAILRSVGGPATVEDKLAAYHRLSNGYYMSYSSGLTGPIARLSGIDVVNRPETVGRPMAHAKVEIVDPETLLPLPVGHAGLIRVTSAQVAERVIVAEAGQAGDRHGPGWGIPGDFGALDAEGFLTITGREADMIVRGGVNVAPQELERTLRLIEGVDDVAVVGIEDAEFGQEIAAFFVTRLDETQLHAACMRACSSDRRPRIIRRVRALPYNAAGKLVRGQLATMLTGQDSQDTSQGRGHGSDIRTSNTR